MKLSTYAHQIGATYKTAHRCWKAGKLDAYQLDIGAIVVRKIEREAEKPVTHVALYARVSSVEKIGMTIW
jgi:putative resolvase